MNYRQDYNAGNNKFEFRPHYTYHYPQPQYHYTPDLLPTHHAQRIEAPKITALPDFRNTSTSAFAKAVSLACFISGVTLGMGAGSFVIYAVWKHDSSGGLMAITIILSLVALFCIGSSIWLYCKSSPQQD